MFKTNDYFPNLFQSIILSLLVIFFSLFFSFLISFIDTNNSVIVGTGLEKYKQANISNLADTLVIDENFRASSTFLSKVDLNFQKELISNQIPLVPFNSYSFGS